MIPRFFGSWAWHAACAFHTNIPRHRVLWRWAFGFHPLGRVGSVRPNAFHPCSGTHGRPPRFERIFCRAFAWCRDDHLDGWLTHVHPRLHPPCGPLQRRGPEKMPRRESDRQCAPCGNVLCPSQTPQTCGERGIGRGQDTVVGALFGGEELLAIAR